MRALVSDLNHCSQRGLVERFDSTNGAASLMMPFGGSRQLTPAQAMASRISVEGRESETASVMSYGFDPYETESILITARIRQLLNRLRSWLRSARVRRMCI